MLSILLMFTQLMCSLFSLRICATVPPHRLHEFIAECTGLVPRPMLNQEGMLNMGMFIIFCALGVNMVLRHPGVQGIIEGVLIAVVPFYIVLRLAFGMSFQTRILWSVAWGRASAGLDPATCLAFWLRLASLPLHPLLLLTQTSPDPLPPPGPGFRSADHPKKFKQESNLLPRAHREPRAGAR